MSGAGGLLKGLVSISSMRLVTAALSFLMFGFLARSWGAATLGEFSTLFSCFMFLLQMPLLGLHWMVAREVARDPATVRQQTSDALALALPVALVLAALTGFAGSTFYPAHMAPAFWLVAAACIPMALTVVAEAVLQGQQRMPVIAGANIVETLVRVALCMTLLLAGFGVAGLFAGFLAARLLAVAVYWYRGGLRELWDRRAVSRSGVLHYVRKSPTFFGILVLSTGIGRLDFIFLSVLGTMRDVGLYSPAFKIYEMGLMVPSVITIVLIPVFSRLFSQSRPRFDSLIEAMFRTVFIVGLPCTILLAALAPFLIPLIFGAEYTGGVPVLQTLAFAILFVAMDQVLTVAVLTANREDMELRILAVTFAVYVLLLGVLIAALGYYGAALATLLTTVFKFALRYVLVRRAMRVPPLGTLAKPALAGMAMAATLLAAETTAPLLALLAAPLLYAVALTAMKGVTMAEVLGYRSALLEGTAAP